MGAFGEQLRQAREAKHITLQEIAATTKISCRALQALEDEHFSQLPGGIFNKGFVRAYARYVGLDEDKMLAAYLAAAKVEGSPETDMQAMSSQVATARARALDSSVSGTTVVGILALIVALALGALWLREQRKEAREQAAASQVSSPAPVTVEPPVAAAPVAVPGTAANPADAAQTTTASPTETTTQNPTQNTPSAAAGAAELPSAEATKPGADEAAPVEISISATKRAWISVKSDGKTVESVTLDPDKPELRSRSYKAREKLMLVVGNPAGLTVTYNGKPTGSLGPEGQRETITFTPQGIEKQ